VRSRCDVVQTVVVFSLCVGSLCSHSIPSESTGRLGRLGRQKNCASGVGHIVILDCVVSDGHQLVLANVGHGNLSFAVVF